MYKITHSTSDSNAYVHAYTASPLTVNFSQFIVAVSVVVLLFIRICLILYVCACDSLGHYRCRESVSKSCHCRCSFHKQFPCHTRNIFCCRCCSGYLFMRRHPFDSIKSTEPKINGHNYHFNSFHCSICTIHFRSLN